MGAGTILGLVWTVVSRGFSGRGLASTADRIIDRLADLKNAETEVEKAEIEREIVQLNVIRDLQRPSSRKWFSPMMIGQYLIAVPFGLWWAGIFLVSILNENLGTSYVVQDLPPHVFEMANWLIPAIIVGTVLERRR